jgi:Septum formation initiator
MMSGVLVILALLIAPYVRPWLAQRSQLAQGREEVTRLQKEVDALTAERDRWDDPAYVKAQARARLHLVMPGEVGYVNLEPTPPAAGDSDPRSADAALPPRHDDAWYGALWQSVVGAGTPPLPVPEPAPVPVSTPSTLTSPSSPTYPSSPTSPSTSPTPVATSSP